MGLRPQCSHKQGSKSARIVSGNYDWTIRGIALVKQLKWETVEERRDYSAAVLMYRCLNGKAPFYIANHFTRVSHNHFTRRSQHDAIVPKPNLDVFKRSFLYQGPVLWNNLSQDIKSCNSLACFKRMYKRTYCAR